jgi:hypothetical protein
MMIIQVDNHNREGPGYDDHVVCTGVDEHWGHKILELLIEDCRYQDNLDHYYRLVPNDYKLKVFAP